MVDRKREPRPEPRGGLRGFGFNRVHQLESSCCVMPSEEDVTAPVRRRQRRDFISEGEDPAESLRTAAFAADDRMAFNEAPGQIAQEPRVSIDRASRRRDKQYQVKGNERRRVNSSNISEASSKYRVSDEGGRSRRERNKAPSTRDAAEGQGSQRSHRTIVAAGHFIATGEKEAARTLEQQRIG